MVVKERVWNLLLGVIFMNLLVLLGYSENMEKGLEDGAGILYNDDTTFGKIVAVAVAVAPSPPYTPSPFIYSLSSPFSSLSPP